MIHALKTKKEYFDEIVSGNKTFEIRKNDRDFQKGDFLALNEIDENGEYTGRCVMLRVRYILDDQEYCKPGFVAMGFAPCVVHGIMTDIPLRHNDGFLLSRFPDVDYDPLGTR